MTRHNALIQGTDTDGIIYIEYVPYVMYFMIACAALNAVFYAATNIRWLHWRDNIIPSLIYWPVLLGTLLVISLEVLY